MEAVLRIEKSRWVWQHLSWLSIASWATMAAAIAALATGIGNPVDMVCWGLIFPLTFGIGCWLKAKQLKAYQATLYHDRIEAESGWLMFKQHVSIPLRHVKAVTCHQTLLGRWLNYGNVWIEIAGGFGADMTVRWVEEPRELATAIRERIKP